MSGRVYSSLRRPRPTCYDASVPQPAAFLACLLDHALNHGLPARRRGGPVLAVIGRHGLAPPVLATLLRGLPRRRSDRADRIVASMQAAWPVLAERSTRLTAEAPPLSLLEVGRSASRIVFLFGSEPFPLLVAKFPRGETAPTVREAEMLERVAVAGLAPRALGTVGGAWVQEGLPGLPARVDPVSSRTAGRMPWTSREEQLSAALTRLASSTAHLGSTEEYLLQPLDRALDHPYPQADLRLLRAARNDLRRLRVVAVQHKDLSAQNWMVDDSRFVGLVDWEKAVPDGIPGFDDLHVAVAAVEHGVGLTRWSDHEVVASFREAWTSSPLFAGARAGARESARAAGVPEALLEPLEVAFFARRLGRRLTGSSLRHLDVGSVAQMLSVVCRP